MIIIIFFLPVVQSGPLAYEYHCELGVKCQILVDEMLIYWAQTLLCFFSWDSGDWRLGAFLQLKCIIDDFTACLILLYMLLKKLGTCMLLYQGWNSTNDWRIVTISIRYASRSRGKTMLSVDWLQQYQTLNTLYDEWN